ncbi:hypothetical protein FSP39_024478 [Pinctada imbricata]|uniref:C1q domain-containing protein n=1 Tax=Pinctada imbricata TaxID=66713 RepID=A0AA88XDV8_PINIB|nr:hypothetical protein FSP39_024478 [Pinctada imbricata]
MTQYQPIIFTEVITNEGSAYNASTGEFTAPSTGAYTFFYEFLVYPSGLIVLELQKENQTFAHSYAYGSDSHFKGASRSAIIDLVKGEKVKVVYFSGNGTLHGATYNKYTTFSGFKL